MTRYPRTLVIVHWIMAIMILGSLIAGKLFLDDVPNSDPAKLATLRLHMQAGGVIILLTVLRIVVRLRGPNPPSDNLLAAGLHGLMYLAVIALLASGPAMAVTFGLPDILWGGVGTMPESLAGGARTVHGLAANLLIAMIILHIAAALWHMVKRDGVMARMSLRK